MKQLRVTSLSLIIPLILGGLLFAPAILRAQTYIYTATTGGTVTNDGAGNWKTASAANWILTTSPGSTAVNWVNNKDAIIGNGGTPGLISCGSAIVVGNVTFNPVASGWYTFNSGYIRVGGAGAHGNVSTFYLPSGVTADFGNNGGSSQYLALGTSGSGIAADGGGTLILSYSAASTYTGASTVQGGTTLYIGAGFVSSASSVLNLISGTLGTFNATARTWTKPVSLQGNFTLGAPSPRNGSLTFGTGAWTLSGGSWTLTNDTTANTINSAIGDGGSGLGLGVACVNGGTLTLGLSGTEGYTGLTTINSGTLALASGCNLNAASGVSIAAGSTFDVSAKTTWTAGTTASPAIIGNGAGTAATIKGGTTVAFGARPITLNYDGSHDTMLTVSQGALTMGANTITINGGSSLSHGTHNIIEVDGGSITLSASPVCNGTAFASGDSVTNIYLSGGTPNYLVIDVGVTPLYPVLDTDTKSAITNSTATLGATVTSDNGFAVTDYGIVWGTIPNPTTANNKVQAGTSISAGTPFTFGVTGLPAATTVYYRGYAINSHGTGYATNDSFLTLANEPATPASSVNLTALQSGGLFVSWVRGNGSKCIVLVKSGSAVDSDPVDATTYTASASLGASQIGSGNFVAYLGTGTNVTLTGLSSGTTYFVAVYELGGSGGSENYLISPATGSQSTVSSPITSLKWTGGTDTDWNNAANWDQSVVPDMGTPVEIPSDTSNQPVYSNPMTAASIGNVTTAGTLTINTNGFNSGSIFLSRTDGSAQMFVNTGGAVNVSGNLGICSNAIATMSAGSSMTVSGGLIMGSDTGGGSGGATASGNSYGNFTNWGGTLSAASTSFNPKNASIGTSCRLVIAGGTNNLGAVSMQRGNSTAQPLGSDGLIISNGVVTMRGISVGNNAFGTIYLVDGLVTNNGTFTLQNTTAGRPARFVQNSGIFVNTNTVTMTGAADTVYAALGGTNSVAGFVFSGTTVLFTNQTKMFIGSAGISGSSAGLTATLDPTGTFGASADWTNTVSLALNGGNFDCQDASGTPHNIYSSGILIGGVLLKSGNGTMTLNAGNTYSGNTIINAGTLALGASGSVNNSGQVLVGSGATFDVSQNSGYTLPATKSLGGMGVVTGNVAFASSAILNPGSNTVTGTLTFSNSITETGGAVNHFDLSSNPAGPNNDLVVVQGDINVSGVSNILEIVGGGSAGTIYPLFKYSGNLTGGGLSSFAISGASGYLTNYTTTTPKSISLVVATAIRSPTNIVWIGNATNSSWDVLNSTNWLNNGSLDRFVTGDTATFNNSGLVHPSVSIDASVLPAAVVVSSTGDYTFIGAAGIGGLGGITKTNTGRLFIQNTNQFSGGMNINQGTVSVSSLADDNTPSPLGQTGTLLLNGGTLEYTGSSTTWTRSLTMGTVGGAVSLPSGVSLTSSGGIGGGGSLTKADQGTLTLGTANSYSGGTYLSGGTLVLNNVTGAGSGNITFTGNSTLSLDAIKPANTIVLSNSSGTISGGNTGGLTGIKNVVGSSNLVLAVTTGAFDLTGDMSTYSGTITLNNAGGGTVRLNGSSGSRLATWDLGTGTMELDIRASTATCFLGALTGGSSSALVGHNASDTLTAATYIIGDNGANTTFDGVVKDGARSGQTLSIIKTGTGKLTLTGANTFTGTTTVSNGTLLVNGSLAAASAVTVLSGTLGGSGTIGGSTTLNDGAFLAPGVAGAGTLTFSANLTLSGAVTNLFTVTSSGGVSNPVAISGTLSPNNSVISITSGTSLQVGTYTLFSYSGNNGSTFDATPVFDVLPAAAASIVDTGSGQINLVIGSVPGPTIASSISGNTLSLTWPAGQGWQLQSQTNNLSSGLSSNPADWSTVSDAGDGSASINMDPAQPAVFYRLTHP
jgi:fibronectin-binding autotransporter adhesin